MSKTDEKAIVILSEAITKTRQVQEMQGQMPDGVKESSLLNRILDNQVALLQVFHDGIQDA